MLFSFQDNGTHLSLGLNVGGYVECDAPIRPEQVLDGGWHHCAATFDGRFMRVYLDGREIGSLERPGTIRAGGTAPGCIGSLNGAECFQGVMDDLRIYAEGLSAAEIAALHRDGRAKADRLAREMEKSLGKVYARRATFAETLAATRRTLLEKGVAAGPQLATAVLGCLKADFPKETELLIKHAGISPADYLRSADDRVQVGTAGRLVELAAEYKPLTEGQWARQTPEARKAWHEVDEIRKRFERLTANDHPPDGARAARFSPEWIELILAAAPHVQERPRVYEAVAPYIPPSTPPLKNLTAEEARGARARLALPGRRNADAPADPAGDRLDAATCRADPGRLRRRRPACGKTNAAETAAPQQRPRRRAGPAR